MKFIEACQRAADQSESKGIYTRHVCATLHKLRFEPGEFPADGHPFSIDPDGFYVSDWYDGAVVQTYHNGMPTDPLG